MPRTTTKTSGCPHCFVARFALTLVATLLTALFFALSISSWDTPLSQWIAINISNIAPVRSTFQGITTLGASAFWLVFALFFSVSSDLVRLVNSVARGKASPTKAHAIQRRKKGAYLLLTVFISSKVVSALKHAFGRPRPLLCLEQSLCSFAPFSHLQNYESFPSGHSQAAWAAMTALSLLYPKHRLAFLTIAALTSLSRLILLKHYLSDVVAGAIVGVAVTLILWKLFSTWINEDASTLRP